MHWFYKAFKENLDKNCPEDVFDPHSGKSIREQALVHMKKMEEIIKSTKPSTELDELFGIIFPKVIEDLNKQKRPKTYEELEKDFNKENLLEYFMTDLLKYVISILFSFLSGFRTGREDQLLQHQCIHIRSFARPVCQSIHCLL